MIDQSEMFTSAWLLIGITGSTPGNLELAQGRISFTTSDRQIFEVPVSSVTDVNFPWYYFGGGVKFRIGSESYRISFVEPGEHGNIRDGRRAGKAWKAILAS